MFENVNDKRRVVLEARKPHNVLGDWYWEDQYVNKRGKRWSVWSKVTREELIQMGGEERDNGV